MNNYTPTTTQRKGRNPYKQNLPRLSHNETKSRDIVTRKETESVIKNLPTNKSLVPDGFSAEFHKICKDLTPILLKLFQKLQRETPRNSLYETSITLTPKLEKDTTIKGN